MEITINQGDVMMLKHSKTGFDLFEVVYLYTHSMEVVFIGYRQGPYTYVVLPKHCNQLNGTIHHLTDKERDLFPIIDTVVFLIDEDPIHVSNYHQIGKIVWIYKECNGVYKYTIAPLSCDHRYYEFWPGNILTKRVHVYRKRFKIIPCN